ncbi:phage tail protein [Caproicibacterium amylolyticum]|uniref:Phage tail protein n=1 Tax=Caproicibacterium amylolyticum TaxID=2766537 RepID=A0A7G9WGR5_9FIRM|nr:phage tail protein [Caproicibacterium amylolyticum]QNO17877.1 phage tail protein [Caproicibacterium amylolyticum]
MADNFGFKIGVEGEKEFKKALSDINQSFKVLGSEMALVTSQFDKNDRSVQAVTARNTVLNKEIDAQKEKIGTLKAALDNAASSFGENDRRTQNWQIQLNKAHTELNGMERELSGNEKILNEIGDEFQDGAKSANKFGDEITTASKQSDEASGRFDKLGGIVKGIGASMGVALAGIGAAAVGAGKSLVDASVNSAAYADDILTMSAQTHMSTEALQAYKYAAELVDTPLETLTGSMAKQIRSMNSAAGGSKDMTAAYAKLGVSIQDSNGHLKNSEDVYWSTIDALGKVKDSTERDALSMQIFGKSAQDLNPLIEKGSAGIKELAAEATNMGAVMSGDQLNSLGKFDDTVQRLKSGASAAKNVLGTVLLPQMQTLASSGVSLLGTFTKGLSDAGGDWTKISKTISTTIGGLTSSILAELPKVVQAGLDIVLSIGNAITANLPMIISSAVTIVMTLLQGLIGALPQITQGALQLILALVNGIIANLPQLVSAALTMIITLASGIGDALPKLIPAIIDAVLTIVNTLLNNMDKVIAAAFKIIEGLAKGLINALPRLIDRLPQIIDSIVNFIINNLPLIIELGVRIIVELAVGLIKAIPTLVAKLPQIISSLVNGFGKLLGAFNNIGSNIVSGIWQGISGMKDWIYAKVKDFFSGIVDSVKGMLGIHSPSTVFAGIGGYMAQGLGQGFSKAMSDISADMQSAIPTAFNLNPALNIGSSINSAGGKSLAGGGFTLHIENFVNNTDKDIERLAYEFEFYRQQAAAARGNA